jgi:predicted O-methyltransferase YrrM
LIRKFLKRHPQVMDLFLLPFAIVATSTMWAIRRVGIERLPRILRVFRRIGIYPIRDHYYEPWFEPATLRYPLQQDRNLPGVDMNVGKQLDLLKSFDYNDELVSFPVERQKDFEFYYDNQWFGCGDAEYLYNVIRFFKPRRMLEIGSGYSTLLAASAIRANRAMDANYDCKHICIEPYEMPWLEKLGLEVLREPVECIGKNMFGDLERNDILFIDSSHMIRPQGDVLFEYLELLPTLNQGVLVHIHDIFTPKDYPEEWLDQMVIFWNEQYLVEAFLSFNKEFEVVGALNFLSHHFPEELTACCPVLRAEIDLRDSSYLFEPKSFWIRRV